MATRYHINFDGKIYPCRAKVQKCPYSESLHSEDKVELYYKLMVEDKGIIEPSSGGLEEIKEKNRIGSLESLSDDIENSNAPIELIIHTLGEGLDHISKVDMRKIEREHRSFFLEFAERVSDLKRFGVPVPENVPVEIADKAESIFRGENLGVTRGIRTRPDVLAKERFVVQTNYDRHYNYVDGLNKDNYVESYEWMSSEFEKFTRDLNASKMLTQPVFFGNLDRAKEIIRNMNGRELLSAFEDYSLSKSEIEESIKEANYFEYTERSDLSEKANEKLKTWYDRNKEIYKSWKINSSKRILLSMEIADEIDRRNYMRPDKRVGYNFEDDESE